MLIDVVIFIIVLGLLVFFHEMGHFLAAKACGIYVDRFSLGMPPRIGGIRLGETDYCLGALPLGGYVKMAGQEDAPLSEEEREQTYGHVPEHRWFNKKPVWQRMIVIVAGPLMNVVLAVLLYAVYAFIGGMVPESEVDNRIGKILPDSPAATAPLYRIGPDGEHADLSGGPDDKGWRTGDRIVTIDGNRIRNIMDVAIDAILGAGKIMEVRIDRPEPDGSVTKFLSPVEPKPILTGEQSDRHPRFGIAPFEAALVDSLLADSPANAAGIQPGDVIVRANGQAVDRTTFVELVEKTPEGDALKLEVEREGKTLPVSSVPQTVGRFMGLGFGVARGTQSDREDEAQPVVGSVSGPAVTAGFKAKDHILTINGQPATITLLRETERKHPGDSVEFTVFRPAVLHGFLRKAETRTIKYGITPVRAIGVVLGEKMVFYRVAPAQVLPESLNLSWQALARTMRTLQMLVTGGVSPKELGGPVMIYQVTTSAAHAGLSWLLKITAFISVNLCVFNLLPLPVLDGGLIVCFLIEGIRRKPVDVRILERIQQGGLLLIVGLVIYVTFNDITRWVHSLVE
jgi:regulator of sigma E protease